MELGQKLVELLERAWAEERFFLERLPEDERSAPGELHRWGPKDSVAHVADWKERLAQNLAAGDRGAGPLAYPNYLEINDQGFLEHCEQPWTAVLEWAETAHRHLVAQVERRSEAELRGTAPWPEGQPLWQRIANGGFVHAIQMHLCPYYAERGQEAYADALQEEALGLLGGLDEGAGWQGTVRYNLACHYALSGRKEAALARLGEALALNPGLRDWARQDTDLDSLRQEPGYLQLVPPPDAA